MVNQEQTTMPSFTSTVAMKTTTSGRGADDFAREQIPTTSTSHPTRRNEDDVVQAMLQKLKKNLDHYKFLLKQENPSFRYPPVPESESDEESSIEYQGTPSTGTKANMLPSCYQEQQEFLDSSDDCHAVVGGSQLTIAEERIVIEGMMLLDMLEDMPPQKGTGTFNDECDGLYLFRDDQSLSNDSLPHTRRRLERTSASSANRGSL